MQVSCLLGDLSSFVELTISLVYFLPQMDKKKPHPKHCNCSECRQKFGNLHVLADAACKQKPSTSTNTHQKPSTSSQHTTISCYQRRPPSTFQTSSLHPCTSYQQNKDKKKPARVCSYCSKEYTHTGDLRKHERSHTGEKPYACPVCHMRFPHSSNMQRHLSNHSDDRPYRCEMCGNTYTRKDKLNDHRKSCRGRR